ERPTRHGLPDHVRMQRELVAKRGSDEVRAVRIEAFLDQEVDVAEIDHPDIDRHLLRLARAWPVFDCRAAALHAIPWDSIWTPIGTQIDLSGATNNERTTVCGPAPVSARTRGMSIRPRGSARDSRSAVRSCARRARARPRSPRIPYRPPSRRAGRPAPLRTA